MKKIRSAPSRTTRLAAQAKPHEQEDECLSTAEKRRRIAKIVRFQFMDCLDDTGSFSVDRARRVIPASAAQHIHIREITRSDRQGKPIVQRDIRMRLANSIQAMRLDDALLTRQEKKQAEDAANAEADEEMDEQRTAAEQRAREFLKEMAADTERLQREVNRLRAEARGQRQEQAHAFPPTAPPPRPPPPANPVQPFHPCTTREIH